MIERFVDFFIDETHDIIEIHFHDLNIRECVDRKEFFDELLNFLHKLSQTFKEPDIMKLIEKLSG